MADGRAVVARVAGARGMIADPEAADRCALALATAPAVWNAATSEPHLRPRLHRQRTRPDR
jgi:hypothetical protein